MGLGWRGGENAEKSGGEKTAGDFQVILPRETGPLNSASLTAPASRGMVEVYGETHTMSLAAELHEVKRKISDLEALSSELRGYL